MERSEPAAAPVNITARTMQCPRCQCVQLEQRFEMLGMSPHHATSLVPVYRCGACHRPFALRPGQLGAA